jgi:hypothetical protein
MSGLKDVFVEMAVPNEQMRVTVVLRGKHLQFAGPPGVT